MKAVLLGIISVPCFAFASFEGTWVGAGGSLKNNRGYETRCESARLEVIGDIGSYRVSLEASCGGIHYNEKFSDVKTQGENQITLRDAWGQVVITKLQGKLHCAGNWYNISWPNTQGTVDANLEIDFVR